MRRKLFVLTVAALMAAMMVVSAGPAQANETNFRNSTNVVQFGNSLVGFGDIDDDDDDIFGCCRHRLHHLHSNVFDDDIFGCCRHNDGIIFGGLDRDSDSDIDIEIG